VTGLRAIRGFLPRLLAAALIDWLGTGLFLAMSTVFFIRVVGLSVTDDTGWKHPAACQLGCTAALCEEAVPAQVGGGLVQRAGDPAEPGDTFRGSASFARSRSSRRRSR
jgi:hypothetical protein